MRSMSATEVPPNFITRRAMAANPRQVGGQGSQTFLEQALSQAPEQKGAYTYRQGLDTATDEPGPLGHDDARWLFGPGRATMDPRLGWKLMFRVKDRKKA